MDSEKKRQYDTDNRVNPMKVDILESSTRSFLFSSEIAKCWVCVGISSLDGMVDEKAKSV